MVDRERGRLVPAASPTAQVTSSSSPCGASGPLSVSVTVAQAFGRSFPALPIRTAVAGRGAGRGGAIY